jgi:hypothetical protein
MQKLTLALLAIAATAQATPSFRASVQVSREAGQVTIDMCETAGENLRYGWDYDADGRDDQRGPCRRTLDQAGPVRVSVWEAVPGERGRHEETIWPPTASSFGDFVPVVWHNTNFAWAVPGIPAEFVFMTCNSSLDGKDAADPESGIISAFDLDGDGIDDQVGSTCHAKLEIPITATKTVRVTVRTADASYVEYITVSATLGEVFFLP